MNFRKDGPGIKVGNHLISLLGVQVSLTTLIQSIVFISTLMLQLDVISSGMILTAMPTQVPSLIYLKMSSWWSHFVNIFYRCFHNINNLYKLSYLETTMCYLCVDGRTLSSWWYNHHSHPVLLWHKPYQLRLKDNSLSIFPWILIEIIPLHI